MSAVIEVRVSAARMLTPVVREFTLQACSGPLPPFSPGSHVQVHLPLAEGKLRNAYSLTSDPADNQYYRIAVRLQENSRGGSQYLHRQVRVGDTLQISPPANLFALHSTASLHILIAGGIGITPFMAYIAALEQRKADFELHYLCRLKNQRPELWNVYNGNVNKGESIRVFPLSNWTELDIWQYIYLEGIPIVPLYFAAEREVIEKNGTLIMIDDDRILEHLSDEDKARIVKKKVRFRTLGCYPLTGAVESEAETLTDIIQEMLLTRTSERQGRVIDHDGAGSMEDKKRQGYF